MRPQKPSSTDETLVFIVWLLLTLFINFLLFCWMTWNIDLVGAFMPIQDLSEVPGPEPQDILSPRVIYQLTLGIIGGQLLYLLPLGWWLKKRQKTAALSGLITAAVLTTLILGSCFLPFLQRS